MKTYDYVETPPSFIEFNKKPGKYQGWWLKKNMESIDKLEKENEKYLKQIEKFLKRTIKYWRIKKWRTCESDYILEIEVDKYTAAYGREVITNKILVEYNGNLRKFVFRTEDYDLIIKTVIKIVEDKMHEVKRKNCKLYWFLESLKRLSWR